MQGKVLVFSVALEGFSHIFADCIRSQREYCHRCDFKYAVVNRAPQRLCRDEAGWLKVPLIRAALAANYEWVAFLDADCEIRPQTPCFPDYLKSLPESKSVFMAPGFSGRINSGVIFARNNPPARTFFDTLMANADCEVPAPEDRVGWGENGHFIFYGKNNPAVYLLEHDLWNNNSHLDGQSYIQHYVRGPMREWYMAHHNSKKTSKNFIGAFFDRAFDTLTRRVHRDSPLREKPLVISESTNRLMPYFLKQYPEFRGS